MQSAKALVLGANGRFGMAMVQALLDQGWQVRALTRSGFRGADRVGAAPSHALNPPRYPQACWRCDALPMPDNELRQLGMRPTAEGESCAA